MTIDWSPRWRCHICGQTRPDAQISVVTTDISADYGMAEGVFKQNVRYCNDCPVCTEQAKTFRLMRPQALKPIKS